MSTLTLKKSPVVFNQEAHTYHLGEQQLSGVTSMLHATLFADKYAGIDQAVLNKAAAYGTSVHEGVELFETLGIDDGSQELVNYVAMRAQLGLCYEASEYLVSDEQTIASSIDLVLTDKESGEIVLADIKTTYGGLDTEYLSWQLSIYAYLFERQNPGLKVGYLMGIWLRHEECDHKTIRRHSNEDVEQLIREYAAGCEVTVDKSGLPDSVHSLADAIADMERSIKTMTAQRDELKERMLAVMKDNLCEKVDIDGKVLVTYIAPTTRESLDSKALKADHPELYARYTKTSPVKESLKITIR